MRPASPRQGVREEHEIIQNIKPQRLYNYMTTLLIKSVASAGLTEEWNMQKAVTVFLGVGHSTQDSVSAPCVLLLI